MINTMTMDYEPYVNYLLDGSYGVLRACYFFPQSQQCSHGRRVTYDGRIIDDMAPRVSNNPWTMPLRR